MGGMGGFGSLGGGGMGFGGMMGGLMGFNRRWDDRWLIDNVFFLFIYFFLSWTNHLMNHLMTQIIKLFNLKRNNQITITNTWWY